MPPGIDSLYTAPDDDAPEAQEGTDDAPEAQEGTDDAPEAQEGTDDAPEAQEGTDAPEDASVKLEEVTVALNAALAQIAALKTQNYDFLMALGATITDDAPKDSDNDASPTIDDLFI